MKKWLIFLINEKQRQIFKNVVRIKILNKKLSNDFNNPTPISYKEKKRNKKIHLNLIYFKYKEVCGREVPS